MKRSVYIVGALGEYASMFKKEGWEIVPNLLHASLVQFTGGEDVNPALYGEKPHPSTFFNPARDDKEAIFFEKTVAAGIPMAGICRGGQFLNVMNGGRMWQHVDGHAISGTHECEDVRTGEVFQVTSTHHQMMIPSKVGAVEVGVAFNASWKERMRPGHPDPLTLIGRGTRDHEIIFYPKTKSLCFQPHPEFQGFDELRVRYFQYIDELLFSKEN